MKNQKLSTFNSGLIWFGAAVSIAEILTGTYFAPLGLKKGLLAIVLGHIIGCSLLFLAGLIGANTKKSSMETTKISFGQKGSILFSLLNIVQLIGWTAVMIYDSSISANNIMHLGINGWAIIITALIILWIVVGIKNSEIINIIAMGLLFILTLFLCKIIFLDSTGITPSKDILSFGQALELSIAMPLSWLPLISDYTKEAEKPFLATLISTIVYGLTSSWMYVIGLGASLLLGVGDIAEIMLKAGFGIIGLLIILFSTVTTTFMDAFSAGVSSEAVSKKLNGKVVAVIVSIIGCMLTMIYPMDNIIGFLYFIGSVFTPMIAIIITDYFFLKNDTSNLNFNYLNIFSWFIGFIIYRYLMKMDIIIGNSIPDVILTMIVTFTLNKIFIKYKVKSAIL